MKLAGSSANTLQSSALRLLFSSRVLRPSLVTLSSHKSVQLNATMHLISGTFHYTPFPWLPVLSNIEPPALWRKATTDKLMEKIVKLNSWPIQLDILYPPLLRLTSRNLLWLDLQPIDIKSRWRLGWKRKSFWTLAVTFGLKCRLVEWITGHCLFVQQ